MSPLESAKLVAFVAARDAGRANEFYGARLGLRLESEDGFALVFDAGGTRLRVALVKEFTPAQYTVLGWEVPDIGEAVRRLEQAGIALQRYGFPGQDERGIWTSPSGARVAWFQDPDGNVLSVTQW